MRDCDRVEGRLSAYLERSLGARERSRVARHLLACGACRSLHDELAALARDMSVLAASLDVPAGLGERVLARVPGPPRPICPPLHVGAARVRRIGAWRAAGWAAVMVGACWQLLGGAVVTRAADAVEPISQLVTPAAADVLGDVHAGATLLRGKLPDRAAASGARRLSEELGALGRRAHEAVFGPDADSPPPEPRSR